MTDFWLNFCEIIVNLLEYCEFEESIFEIGASFEKLLIEFGSFWWSLLVLKLIKSLVLSKLSFLYSYFCPAIASEFPSKLYISWKLLKTTNTFNLTSFPLNFDSKRRSLLEAYEVDISIGWAFHNIIKLLFYNIFNITIIISHFFWNLWF